MKHTLKALEFRNLMTLFSYEVNFPTPRVAENPVFFIKLSSFFVSHVTKSRISGELT